MEDKCRGCIRIDSEMKFKIEICPKCNNKTYEGYLDGRCYIRKCTTCGDGYVSFSYYGNCEGKRDICEYSLDFSKVEKNGIMEFAERYNIKPITLMKWIRMKKLIRLRCELSDVLEEEAFFQNINLKYNMETPMMYSRFYSCKDAIRSKWLTSDIEIIVD